MTDSKCFSRAAQAACLLMVLLATTCMVTYGHEEHIEVANKQVTLKDVCANRQVPIVSVEEARRLIKELYKSPETCQENYRQSFYELETVLVVDNDTPLCSEQEFREIADYHFRYINPMQEAYKLGDDLNNLNRRIIARPLHENKVDYTVQLDDYKQEILIPISLSQFFKAWALQVSGMCKRTFVVNIDKAMQLMSDMDIELLEGGAIKADSGSLDRVGHLLNDVEQGHEQEVNRGMSAKQSKTNPKKQQPNKKKDQHAFQYGLTFNKLVYLPELEGELEEGDIRRHQETKVLDLRSKPELKKFMEACKRRFKPVYSKLVMPIVRLAKLGYDYVGPAIDDIRAKLYNDPLAMKWMLVTMVCESQGENIELVGSSSGSADEKLEPRLEYEPMYNYKIEGALWVKGAEALRRELERISGEHSTGFKRFLYEAGIAGRRAVAFLDPHQFAWYRRNQNTLSSTLNTMSILSTVTSIGLSMGR